MKKIYISGPMTGLPEFNYPAFDAAAAALKFWGHEPLNLASIVVPEGFKPDWKWYMRQAVKMLMEADAVATLPDWMDSRGAVIEVQLANQLDMEVLPIYEWLGTEGVYKAIIEYNNEQIKNAIMSPDPQLSPIDLKTFEGPL